MLKDKTGLIIAFTVLICVSLFVVFYIDESDASVNGYSWIKLKMSKRQQGAVDENITDPTIKTTLTSKTLMVHPTSLLGCSIRKSDPWDPQILYYNDPSWKPSCTQNQTQISQFVNGKLVINETALPKDHYCDGRCLTNIDDWKYKKGEWENATTFVADCDVVEVRCVQDVENKTIVIYNFLHTQILERKDDTNYWLHPKNLSEVPGRKSSIQTEKPNIFVIVFDSASTSEFVRSMSRTLYLMKQRHEAVIFEHMNKVGINSRPNAWTLMFGKQIYELGKNPYTEEIFPDLNHTMNCGSPNDNENYWMHRLRDVGYHTMMADDWASGAVNWPNCYGFNRPPAKHYMKPFQRRNEEGEGDAIRKTIKDMCHETYKDTSLYLDQFMGAYRNQSQLAYIWNSELAHNYANGLYHADDHFYRILKKHEERLNNSFVFILGDHGLRFGGIRSTEVGEKEDNNPLLMVSVPVRFRESKLMTVLKHNAQKLVTHYDDYATLMHLSELAKTGNFDELLEPKAEPFKAGHGSSYFRQQMNEPRDCGTLRIPFEYCLCEKKFEPPVHVNSTEARSMGEFALAHFNSMFDAENVTSLCEDMKIKTETTVANRLVLQTQAEIYRFKFTVLPSDGQFEAYLELKRTKENKITVVMMSKRFTRVNSYGEQGECVKNYEELRPVCYCKNQKKS